MNLFRNLNKLLPVWDRKSAEVSLTDKQYFLSTFNEWINITANKNLVSWVFDCLDIWGKHFAKVNFKLYEKKGTESVELSEHPILDIFTRPNEFQTWWEIKYNIANHFGIYGNSYLWKLRDNTTFATPRQLIQISPQNVNIIPSQNGYVYQCIIGNKIYNIPPEDIIHFRYPNPASPFSLKGRAVIENIKDIADVDKLQVAYMKKFYERGGFFGAVFTTKQELSPTSFKRTVDLLSEKYGGLEQSYKIFVADSGLQPVKAAYSIKDADIKAQRELTRDEVSAAFGVNKFLYGLAESINRATATEVSRQFSSGIIEPLMNYIDDILTTQLAIKDFDSSYYVQHESTAPRDLEGDLIYYQVGLRNGFLTPNEVREEENLEAIDLPYMNVPIDLSQVNAKPVSITAE